MQGDPQQLDTTQDDNLSHTNGTWYLQVTFYVMAEEAAGLSCQVRHRSLGNQNMILCCGETEDWKYN